MRKFNDKTVIKIQGDVDVERQAGIDNSVGQGTNGAVDGCAMMMARLIEQNFQNNEHKITIGDVNIGPTGLY